jgi:Carboxypeptidase regulatory-like domain
MQALGRQSGFGALFLLTFVPAVWAQSGTTAAIAGTVTDASGAVLPGVTVEAASPVLIEKTRAVATDTAGQYRIVDLRPGGYTLTFTLPGFATVRREGLELNTGFTATVDAEMKVGGVEETITVTGASPVVDTQNVRTQNVLTREVLDVVPTSRNYQAFAAMTLGAVGSTAGVTGGGDVGGAKGEQMTGLTIHGAGAGLTTVDGMRINTATNFWDNHRYFFNQLSVQEVVMETGGAGAESMAGGLNVNMVPKDGGNRFSTSVAFEYADRSFQGNNLTDDLIARGLTRTNEIRNLYDFGFGVGGPVRQDKLWFFAAGRLWGSQEELAGIYFNRLQGTLFYEADQERPGYYDNYVKDANLRLTWQATPKQKVTLLGALQDYCRCYSMLGGIGGTAVPESTYDYRMYPNNLFQVNWAYPRTAKFLLEAGTTLRVEHHLVQKPEETGNARSVSDQNSGYAYGSLFSGATTSRSNYGDHGPQGQFSTRFAASYVTGSHAFKAGIITFAGEAQIRGEPVFNEQYTFRNRAPVSLTQVAFPHQHIARVKTDLGIFAQDQWTIRNVTLNLGVRFDALNSYSPAQTRPGGQYLGEVSFPEVPNTPNWKDINPRLGVSYDLFGNGKTAIKASLGRYVKPETTDITNRTNPAAALSTQASRTWNDNFFGAGDPRSGNYVPDCDLNSRAATGECGALDNQRFGTSVVTTRFADEVLNGWGIRPFNWQSSITLQHELRPGVGFTFGYFRTWWGNGGPGSGDFHVTDNLAVTPADYDPYCITAPVDPRLPGGGGYQVCGLYDIKPAKFGQVDNLVTDQAAFGGRTNVYNGLEFSVNSRFVGGAVLSGGVGMGQTDINNCAAPDVVPQFCENTIPFSGELQVKVSGAYPLPWWGLNLSGVLQNLSGRPQAATYVATNAQIFPSLGRNLAACGTATLATCTATATVTIMEPNTVYEDRYTLLDLRLAKTFRFGRTRVAPRFDIYNVLNSDAVNTLNTRYSPTTTWLRPQEVFSARFFKIGAQVDF